MLATSLGCPSRRMMYFLSIAVTTAWSSIMGAMPGVSMLPRETEFTRMLCLPTALASAREKPAAPALAAD